MDASSVPERQVRAVYDAQTIRVYQAFRHEIADAALGAGSFVAPFRRQRMSWIKPSFLWMMYRCGWTEKEDGQRRVLAVDIQREGFEWALNQATLSIVEGRADRPVWVRVQWDPERDLDVTALQHRALQFGLSGPALMRYADEWIVRIVDATPLVHAIRAHLLAGERSAAQALLPIEMPYPLPPDIAARIDADG